MFLCKSSEIQIRDFKYISNTENRSNIRPDSSLSSKINSQLCTVNVSVFVGVCGSVNKDLLTTEPGPVFATVCLSVQVSPR